MLPTDPYLNISLVPSRPEYGRLHQPPHPLDVNHLEGVVLKNAQLEIGRQKLLLRILPAEGIYCLCQVIGPEREEVGHMSHLARPHAGANGLHHHPKPQSGGLHMPLHPQKLLHRDHLGYHYRDIYLHLILYLGLRLTDSLNLHLVDFGIGDTQPHPPMTDHGINLPELPHPLLDPGIISIRL